MNKDQKMLSILLQSLFQQEIHLSEVEKITFPLINRCLVTMTEIWSSNKTPIVRLNITSVSPTALMIQINDLDPVAFNSPVEEEARYEYS